MAVYTTIDNPELYFQCKIYTGNGSSGHAQTFDGDEDMQPDLVWMKNRDATGEHFLIDSVRGVQKDIHSNTTAAEGTDANSLTAFGTNGFTVGSQGDINGNTEKMVAWAWKAGGGSGSANTDGSINTASTSANTTSKFSIGKFNTNTATSSSSAETIGHGLSGAAKMVILKPLGTDSWYVFHASAGNNTYVVIEGDGASTTNTNTWNNTAPTSSVFSINTTFWGKNTNNIAAYCFADVQGFSKFGSFTGNGNDDGTFVHTGFRPAWTMIKCTSASDHWPIDDNKRSTSNFMQNTLRANLNNAEYTGSAYGIDFLSNGFKVRNDDGQYNLSGGSFVFMAFAESPFVNSNGVPTNAR